MRQDMGGLGTWFITVSIDVDTVQTRHQNSLIWDFALVGGFWHPTRPAQVRLDITTRVVIASRNLQLAQIPGYLLAADTDTETLYRELVQPFP